MPIERERRKTKVLSVYLWEGERKVVTIQWRCISRRVREKEKNKKQRSARDNCFWEKSSGIHCDVAVSECSCTNGYEEKTSAWVEGTLHHLQLTLTCVQLSECLRNDGHQQRFYYLWWRLFWSHWLHLLLSLSLSSYLLSITAVIRQQQQQQQQQ